MKRINYTAVLCLIAVSMLAVRSSADANGDKGPNSQAIKVGGLPSSVQTAEIAGQLAAWARNNHDPVALATAARVLAAEPPQAMPQDGGHQKAAEGGKADGAKHETLAFTTENLLAEARDMGKKNKDVLATIDGIEKTMAVTQGHPGGAVTDHDVLLPDGGKMTYTIQFAAGQPMEVAVFANGMNAVEWHVFDESGNEIDSQASDHFLSAPKWTGPFKIVLTNKTKSYVPYTLATN